MLISDHLCGKLCMVIQMLIDSVVKNEAIRNRQMIEQYETMLQEEMVSTMTPIARP